MPRGERLPYQATAPRERSYDAAARALTPPLCPATFLGASSTFAEGPAVAANLGPLAPAFCLVCLISPRARALVTACL